MATINYAAREINVKIVYYGPALSGKTTNLQIIHKKTPQASKSDMVSLATEADRTLFFDFLPIDLGKIRGFTTKIQLYTVPGQVYYNATRKLVLRGVDRIVFVADSDPEKMPENIESLRNMEENLAEYGYSLESIPVVLQYNKRDLPTALSLEQLNAQLNTCNAKWSEAIARSGPGVFETLKLIGKEVIDILNQKYASPMGAQTQQVPTQAAPSRQAVLPPTPQAPQAAPQVTQPYGQTQQIPVQPATPMQQQFAQPVQPAAPTQQIPVQPAAPVQQQFAQPVQPAAPTQQIPVQPAIPVQQQFAQPVQPAVPVQQQVAQPTPPQQVPVQPTAPAAAMQTLELDDPFLESAIPTTPVAAPPVAAPAAAPAQNPFLDDPFLDSAPAQAPVVEQTPIAAPSTDPFAGAIELDDFADTPAPAPIAPPVAPVAPVVEEDPFLATSNAPTFEPQAVQQAPVAPPIQQPIAPMSNTIEVEDVLDINAITPVVSAEEGLADPQSDQLFFTTNDGKAANSKKKAVNPKHKKTFMNSFNDLFNKES